VTEETRALVTSIGEAEASIGTLRSGDLSLLTLIRDRLDGIDRTAAGLTQGQDTGDLGQAVSSFRGELGRYRDQLDELARRIAAQQDAERVMASAAAELGRFADDVVRAQSDAFRRSWEDARLARDAVREAQAAGDEARARLDEAAALVAAMALWRSDPKPASLKRLTSSVEKLLKGADSLSAMLARDGLVKEREKTDAQAALLRDVFAALVQADGRLGEAVAAADARAAELDVASRQFAELAETLQRAIADRGAGASADDLLTIGTMLRQLDRARLAEVAIRQGEPGGSETAAAAVKEIFVLSLRLRSRLSDGRSVELLSGINRHAQDYRRALAGLEQALAESAEARAQRALRVDAAEDAAQQMRAIAQSYGFKQQQTISIRGKEAALAERNLAGRRAAADAASGLIRAVDAAEQLRLRLLLDPTAAQGVDAALQEISRGLARLAPTLKDAESEAIVSALRQAFKRYTEGMEALIGSLSAGREASAAMDRARQGMLASLDDVSELSAAQLVRTQRVSLGLVLAGAVVALVVGAGLATAIGRGVTRPMAALTEAMRALASGRLDVEVPGLERHDELKAMADALAVFKDRAIATRRLERVFEERVVATVEAIAGHARGVAERTRGMADQASALLERSEAADAATREAAGNVAAVAAGTEELSASVREISQQVGQSSTVAQEAASRLVAARGTIDGLVEAARSVEEVVALIRAIAEQTNLLALNATIEAARAGEAGRGFAVVASEVKSLATQTAKATDDIGAHVAAIASSTQRTVDAVDAFQATLSRLTEIASTVAAAADQQSAATGSIAENTQQASTLVESVARDVADLNQAARETGTAAGELLAVGSTLAEQAQAVRAEVERFLNEVRAA
jgi:methyl-accepting chemotaxis protein